MVDRLDLQQIAAALRRMGWIRLWAQVVLAVVVVGVLLFNNIGGQVATPVDAERRSQLCLTDDEVLALAQLGKRLERLNGAPQDIEFAIDNDLPDGKNIVLLQCRPVTVLPGRAVKPASADALSRMASTVMSAVKPH